MHENSGMEYTINFMQECRYQYPFPLFDTVAYGFSSLVGGHIHEPTVWRVGGVGISNVAPLAELRDRTDVWLMLFLAGEGPVAGEWINVVRGAPRGCTVADIGAAGGAFSILAAVARPDISVVAFEPDPESFERLSLNIKLNYKERQVTAMQVALGASNNDSVPLYTDGANGIAPSLQDGRFSNHISVRMRSLDYFVQKGIISPPWAVKVDVEGGEAGPNGVFAGMKWLLGHKQPEHIFLETHRPEMMEQFGGTTEDLLTMLMQLKYQQAYRYERTPGIPIIHFVIAE